MHPANNGDYESFVPDGLGLGLGQRSTHRQTSIERAKQERPHPGLCIHGLCMYGPWLFGPYGRRLCGPYGRRFRGLHGRRFRGPYGRQFGGPYGRHHRRHGLCNIAAIATHKAWPAAWHVFFAWHFRNQTFPINMDTIKRCNLPHTCLTMQTLEGTVVHTDGGSVVHPRPSVRSPQAPNHSSPSRFHPSVGMIPFMFLDVSLVSIFFESCTRRSLSLSLSRLLITVLFAHRNACVTYICCMICTPGCATMHPENCEKVDPSLAKSGLRAGRAGVQTMAIMRLTLSRTANRNY
jgi:hypothetical protein